MTEGKCSRCGCVRELVARTQRCQKCYDYHEGRKLEYHKEKEENLEKEIARGNINAGIKPVRDTFPTWQEWHAANPNENFQEYLVQKSVHETENRPQPMSKDPPIDTSQPRECIIIQKWLRAGRPKVDSAGNRTPLWVYSHLANCDRCASEAAKYGPVNGVNLW